MLTAKSSSSVCATRSCSPSSTVSVLNSLASVPIVFATPESKAVESNALSTSPAEIAPSLVRVLGFHLVAVKRERIPT